MVISLWYFWLEFVWSLVSLYKFRVPIAYATINNTNKNFIQVFSKKTNISTELDYLIPPRNARPYSKNIKMGKNKKVIICERFQLCIISLAIAKQIDQKFSSKEDQDEDWSWSNHQRDNQTIFSNPSPSPPPPALLSGSISTPCLRSFSLLLWIQ